MKQKNNDEEKQLKEALRFLAHQISLYYDALVLEGFDETQALHFATVYLKHILESSVEMYNDDEFGL